MDGSRQQLTEILRNPASSDLFLGFDSLTKTLLREKRIDDRQAPTLTLDSLLALCEYTGARKLENPERYTSEQPQAPEPNELLAELDAILGIEIPIPNPFPGEFGLKTRRGVATYRAVQAMYQAQRIREEVEGINEPRIVEVGGGLGRTAYYSHQLGLLDYTIVDIPMTAVAQGYFLGRVLGADCVTLGGEPRRRGAVALLTPSDFHNGDLRYHLAFNSDSITELPREAAVEYWQTFRSRVGGFLSINHEDNEFTVREFIESTKPAVRSTRNHCWMLRGYAEEIVHF